MAIQKQSLKACEVHRDEIHVAWINDTTNDVDEAVARISLGPRSSKVPMLDA